MSVTEVTITDKNCAEIAAFFVISFLLKAVDTDLQNKCQLVSPEKKNDIHKLFRDPVYAFSEAKS